MSPSTSKGRPPRRKVLRHSRFVGISHAPYTLYLQCGHVVGSSRIGKTHGCRQCAAELSKSAP
mgnify:CR=1 FL=1